ncbi:hypothetical protein EVAR_62648_1 [Eumeta japonica]|uniref:Uncharacterized protein n=1 Tax=Eumeta variegata TaxID=151549 RepID=A0A4C1ZDF8_EUMVA|nr:hypothetical protein EVAR_62648_1 [Eumeta japonica]
MVVANGLRATFESEKYERIRNSTNDFLTYAKLIPSLLVEKITLSHRSRTTLAHAQQSSAAAFEPLRASAHEQCSQCSVTYRSEHDAQAELRDQTDVYGGGEIGQEMFNRRGIDIRNPRRVTSALPAYWEGIEYPMAGRSG